MSSEILWPKHVVSSLCEMVQQYRNLWDSRDANYCKHKLRQKHFGDLAQELCKKYPEMSITGEAVRLKFKKLKTYFLKEYKKIQSAPSGSAGKTLPKWEFFEFLLYLSDTAEVTSFDRSWNFPSNHKAACASVTPVQEDDVPEMQTLEINCDDTMYSDVLPEWLDGEELDETSSTARMHSASQSPAPVNDTPKKLPSLPGKRQSKKRKSELYNQAIDMALQMALQQNEKPSYAAAIASTIENLINMCPEKSRRLVGIRIMQAAHDICDDYIN